MTDNFENLLMRKNRAAFMSFENLCQLTGRPEKEVCADIARHGNMTDLTVIKALKRMSQGDYVRVSFRTLLAISDYFGVTVSELIGETKGVDRNGN